MRYVAEAGLPAVAMCVSTTYGSGDWGRTPHGAFIAGAVFGKLPFMMDGIQLEVVGVDDAARAMILAAEHGRIGERYLISERMIALKEVVRIAADEAGVPPPRRSISVPVLYALGALGSLKARLTGKDAELSLASVRMMRAEADVDHSKAVRELGWQPRPVEESIREAARFWAAMRTARKRQQDRASPNRLAHVERIHVDFNGPPQTMLATLYAKALDADLPNPILGDRYAKEIVERIDYDWTKTAIAARNSPSVTTRTAHFDTWAQQFLAVHPSAVVLHLGCGLDSRYFRLHPGPRSGVV